MSTRESLFSPLWYRVARRRPRFRRDVKVRQMRYRERNWHVLINEATGQQHRASQQAYEFIGRCDGLHTVQEIWDDLLERLGDDAPTQDEVVQLLIVLDEQGIFAYQFAPHAETLVRRRDERMQQKRKPRVNPFALRIPLGNPTDLLKRIQWLAAPLVNMTVVWLWSVMVGLSVLAAVSNWPALKAHGIANLATPHYLFLIWVCFPFIKTLHELAHSITVMRWGGEIREFGVTLFLLMPAPYVDASDAAGFRHRSQRVFVSAAGIMAELALACLALFIWLNVQPGAVRVQQPLESARAVRQPEWHRTGGQLRAERIRPLRHARQCLGVGGGPLARQLCWRPDGRLGLDEGWRYKFSCGPWRFLDPRSEEPALRLPQRGRAGRCRIATAAPRTALRAVVR